MSYDPWAKFAKSYIRYFLEIKYDADLDDRAKVGKAYMYTQTRTHTHVCVSVCMYTYMCSIVVAYYLLSKCYTVIYIYIYLVFLLQL